MKRKHAPSDNLNLTVCGYECTDAEYKRMLRTHMRYVNCKRCKEMLCTGKKLAPIKNG